MNLAILGILMIIVCFALVLSKKVHMIVPFIVVPIIFAALSGASLSEISQYVVDGVSSTNNAVMLVLFSVAYFSLLSETGMFDIIVGKITKVTGNNALIIMLATVVIAMIGHLDGAYNTTYLITIPTLLPIYKRLKIDNRILMFLTVMGATAMCAVPWGASVVQLTPFAEVEAIEISTRLLPFAVLTFAMAVVWAVLFALSYKKNRPELSAAEAASAAAEVDFSDNPNARPQYFWINFAIFAGSIVCLFLVHIQTYILFMIFTALVLVVNYDAKTQTALIRKPSATMLPFVLQYGTACSPLVAATNLGAELAEVNVIDHMKFSAWRCWICSAILIAAMCITGALF